MEEQSQYSENNKSPLIPHILIESENYKKGQQITKYIDLITLLSVIIFICAALIRLSFCSVFYLITVFIHLYTLMPKYIDFIGFVFYLLAFATKATFVIISISSNYFDNISDVTIRKLYESLGIFIFSNEPVDYVFSIFPDLLAIIGSLILLCGKHKLKNRNSEKIRTVKFWCWMGVLFIFISSAFSNNLLYLPISCIFRGNVINRKK